MDKSSYVALVNNAAVKFRGLQPLERVYIEEALDKIQRGEVTVDLYPN